MLACAGQLCPAWALRPSDPTIRDLADPPALPSSSPQTSDLAAATAKLLKSAPSMAVLGDIAHVPRYDQVAKRFA